MATPSEIGALLAVLTAGIPNAKPPSADTVKVYVAMLGDLDTTDLERAVREHLAESKWFPAISELRARARGCLPAADAWAAVEASLGNSRDGRSFDPATDRVLRLMGGRERLGLLPVESLTWERKRFEELYRDEVDRIAVPQDRRLLG